MARFTAAIEERTGQRLDGGKPPTMKPALPGENLTLRMAVLCRT
ncbi:hypothetical protein KM043_018345, partial [Ampulex compressa]